MKSAEKTVTIVGSYNVGLFLKGNKHPVPGETIIGHTFHEGGGGKGSNQCIAAARMGADTRFVGCIGNDKYGEDALELYRKERVSVSSIVIDNSIHTGISVILINDQGENMISVIPGANFRLSEKHIDDMLDLFKVSSIVGFQLENDIHVVEYGIKKCAELGVDVLLDPAPARQLSSEIYKYLTYIKPNEHEAETLSGIKVTDQDSAFTAARWFIKNGVRNVIITLGAGGVVYTDGNIEKFFPALKVEAVDSTGAGDCFSGAFLAGLSSDMSVPEAIRHAIIASGISVTRLGVVESLPFRAEVAGIQEKADFSE